MKKNTSLAQTLAAQEGVITLGQALSCGLTDAAVRWQLNTAAWRRVSAGVFHSSEYRFSSSARLRAALMSAGDGAVAHGPSAAWWLGLVPAAPLVPWVTIPSPRLVRRCEPLIIRRRNLDPCDVMTVRGLAVTTPELTVLETAVELPEGSAFLDQMLLGSVAIEDLHKVQTRNVGRRGSTEAQRLLAAAASGGVDDARRKLSQAIAAADLRGWEAPVAVAGYSLDAGFAAERIGIEVHSWASHPDARRMGRDLRRHNVLIAAGWSILRFDWHRLDSDQAGVGAEMRAALASRQRRVGGR